MNWVVCVTFAVVVSIGSGQRCNTNVVGQRLSDCPMVSVDAGPDPTTLQFTTIRSVYPTCSMTTRAFAVAGSGPATIPGPIIHIKRGTKVRLRLENQLQKGGQVQRPGINGFGEANTTNLHLHGLHVSSAFPGDDMGIAVLPQESFLYEYDIPSDHGGGIFLWHTHHHGSVSLQFSGGALGMLVVDDDQTNSPQGFLQTLSSTFCLLQRVQPTEIADFASITNDDIRPTFPDLSEFYLVNGLPSPIITLPINKWHRLRFAHAAVAWSLTATIPGCDMVLLAIDGVYLTTPRPTTHLEFHPPSRADIAIRCPANSSILGETGNVIATIQVDPAMNGPTTIDQTAWKWARPDYLQDLSSSAISGKWLANVDLYSPVINRRTYRGMDRQYALQEAAVGTIQEWSIESSGHPMHFHVYHMQLAEDMSSFYKAGDWVDTVKGSGVKVRILFAQHQGPAMFHCHVLRHSDQGLMGVVWVSNDTNTPTSLSSPNLGTAAADNHATAPHQQYSIIVFIIVSILTVLF